MFRSPTPKANEMVKANLAGALPPSIIGDKKLLILVSILVVTFIVDSQIGYIADFIPERLVTNEGIALFIGNGNSSNGAGIAEKSANNSKGEF